MHELFEKRWSARGLDSSATISDDDLTAVLDAGRWAPTWGATQPVRFVVGVRGDETFTTLTGILSRGNQPWAPAAAALILVCTRNEPEDENAHTYGAVDLGIATAQMIIQAVALGYVAHPMAGFESAAAIERLQIPAGERPLVLLAIGTLADPSTVDEKIAEKDARERTRLPLEQVAYASRWGHPFR
ncbi:nitroreductase family protein [Williamsia phyllosphaerae]|uniref:Nitroreductase n=1 Tax=Williamsia phyllosphaerae TaxID=885042 RepID=A0ABQ1UIK6_9NOCA|nr:nitroreductase family protein [Williamsia phyllosphaerae]GGF19923.1 nitroreductase [Williamsia phyllosphaerae]